MSDIYFEEGSRADMTKDVGLVLHYENTSPKVSNNIDIAVPQQQQSRIRTKFDRHMLPIVCILYILSFIDRGNIGNAKTAGAQSDLELSSAGWSWVLNSFYICYTCFEWATVFWKLFPAHIYVAILCVLWGAVAAAAGATNNLGQLIVCRALLGVFEAGFGAGAPYYLSMFYQRRELGFRVSLILGMSPLANCFASSLAYGITQITGSIAPWRLLFIIEGTPTIAFAAVVYFLLPDCPDKAKFLTEEEQTLSIERLQTCDTTAKSRLSWHQVKAGLLDWQNYIHALIHFFVNYSYAGLSNFLPTIIQNLGYSSIRAQGLTAPPYFAAFLCTVAAAFFSDRFGNRGFIIAVAGTLATIGYLLLATIQTPELSGVRYLGIWLACCGTFPVLAVNITWLLNNQGGDSKRGAGLAILAIFGQTSSFASSSLFPASDGPYFIRGCALGCGFSGLIVILSLMLHFKLRHENRKRDLVNGPSDENQRIDLTQLSDKHPQFRYLL